jgi:glycosyltransferase involved in cell wall biosynthesis
MDTIMNSLVSIILPVYNGEKYIYETIQSILTQNYYNWELIVVDDGSKDSTSIIVKNFTKDLRVKYYYKKNEGQSKARNFGLKKSTGSYIAFIDSDDLWNKDKLKLQILFLNEFNYSFVFNNFFIIDENSKIIGENCLDSNENTNENLLSKDYIGILTVMFKKSIINEVGYFDENLTNAEDWDYWIRISTQYKLGFLNLSLAYYRQHINGISKNKKNQLNSELIVLKKHLPNSKIISKYQKNLIFWNHYKNQFLFSLKIRNLFTIILSFFFMCKFNFKKTLKYIFDIFYLIIKN